MKKFNKRCLKQCALEPVESVAHVPLPGVPEHFNYGVFFDDGYDYMQHLKEASRSNEKLAYRIVGIPEDKIPEAEELESVEDQPREPEADVRDMVVDGLGLDSDEEVSEASEIEDNFVELAGGHVMDDSSSDLADNSEESGELSPPKVVNPREVLSKDKVLMMERFLYGENERDEQHSDSDSEFQSFEDADEAAMTNRQFEKLLMRLKTQARSAGQSMVTGTSMVSEGLQHALSRDTRILEQRKPKSTNLDDLESDLRAKTLVSADRTTTCGSTESLSVDSNDEDSKDLKTDILSIQSDANCSAFHPSFCLLSVPHNSKSRSRQTSMESLQTVGRNLGMTIMRTGGVDSKFLVRRRGETTEEKHRRKSAVKQYRQERRQIRKINQANFRAEHERQLKNQLNTLTIT